MIARILREKRRIVLPLAIVAVANVLALALVVYPLSRRVEGAQVRAEDVTRQLSTAVQSNRAAQGTLEGRKHTDTQLEKFYDEVLPRDQAAARRMTYLRLAQLAREANLDYSRRDFHPEKVKDATLTRMDMNIALEGDYRDIRRFIHTLETAPEFVIIRSVALAQSPDRSGSGDRRSNVATSGPRPLTVTLTLATYYRSGDEAPGRR
jgi:Tfp pilus assembly protein PilO